jgi:hypothetical protein
MAMIKRAHGGKIEEMVDKNTDIKDQPNLTWSNEILIKDVLDVPTNHPHNIDVDLNDDDDETVVAVKC